MMFKLNGCFVNKDDDLLENITIWDKVALMLKKNDSEPVKNRRFLKTKINLMVTELQTFLVDFNHTYLAVINLYSALKKDENYYLQVFLKECKHTKKVD